MTPAYLIRLFEYNQWANGRVLDAAEALDPALLVQPHGHSWGSVHNMLVHLMAAEWIWLRRLRGHSPGALLDPNEFPTIAAVRTRWAAITSNLFAYLHEQTTESLQQDIAYRSTEGQHFSLPAWQILVHLANHGTHHRGELAAMFALLGVPHEEEDLLYYFLEQSGQ